MSTRLVITCHLQHDTVLGTRFPCAPNLVDLGGHGDDNGTHDVGTLQFNTAYLSGLARYGIVPADVAAAGYYPYDLAAWRLRQHITKDQGDPWTRSANYHSRTPRFNAIYRADLLKRARKRENKQAAQVGLAAKLYSSDRPTSPEGWKAAPHVNKYHGSSASVCWCLPPFRSRLSLRSRTSRSNCW